MMIENFKVIKPYCLHKVIKKFNEKGVEKVLFRII